LVFVSRWSSPRWAEEFAAVYARGIEQRYKKIEAPAASDLPGDLKKLQSLGGDHTWKTEDGAIVVDVKGDTVLVTESLEPAITDQFRSAVLGTSQKH
jgi:hypothetical protein